MVALTGTVLSEFFEETSAQNFPPPCVVGEESIMRPKAHGTSETPVQANLRWSVDNALADRICNYNRHYAEESGYWRTMSLFVEELKQHSAMSGDDDDAAAMTFFDSNTGKPLFVAPRGRTMDEFVRESEKHGWPSFRSNEVVWENVRCLPDGETVSVDGTHLGHNLPDDKGSRFCINLVSVAGRTPTTSKTNDEDRHAL